MIIRHNKLKIIIGANEAKPGGNIGATLSPYLFSVNMNDFCKKFNELTQIYEVGFPLNVIIYCDVVEKQYSFLIKKPSIIIFIRKLRKDIRFKRKFIDLVSFYDLVVYFSENFFINLFAASIYLFSMLQLKNNGVGRLNLENLSKKFDLYNNKIL